MEFDYKIMCERAEEICRRYSFVEIFCIGKSVMKKPIYCFKVGKGSKKLFINGAHHGLEYLTSALIIEFLEKYADAIENDKEMLGYKAKELYENSTLYAVPMVNPDGVELAIHGICNQNKYHLELLKCVGYMNFKQLWQANIRGVDINHNYNADWAPVAPNATCTRYAGPYAESEPETQSLVALTYSIDFNMVIAFHSQGGEIYYDYNGLTAPRSYEFAQKFAELSGYTCSVPEGAASFGGYKDWFIYKFGKEGFTIEIGRGKNPLPMSMLDIVFNENAPIILYALKNL